LWSSAAPAAPEELDDAVRQSGGEVICITDHGTVNGALAVAGRLPCRVIVGQELRRWAGELIGLFLTERLPYGIKPEEAVARIHDQGGLVYVPHPFDPLRHCLREDVLERLA